MCVGVFSLCVCLLPLCSSSSHLQTLATSTKYTTYNHIHNTQIHFSDEYYYLSVDVHLGPTATTATAAVARHENVFALMSVLQSQSIDYSAHTWDVGTGYMTFENITCLSKCIVHVCCVNGHIPHMRTTYSIYRALCSSIWTDDKKVHKTKNTIEFY